MQRPTFNERRARDSQGYIDRASLGKLTDSGSRNAVDDIKSLLRNNRHQIIRLEPSPLEIHGVGRIRPRTKVVKAWPVADHVYKCKPGPLWEGDLELRHDYVMMLEDSDVALASLNISRRTYETQSLHTGSVERMFGYKIGEVTLRSGLSDPLVMQEGIQRLLGSS